MGQFIVEPSVPNALPVRLLGDLRLALQLISLNAP